MTLVLYLHVSRVLSFLFCDDLTTCHQKKKKKVKLKQYGKPMASGMLPL